MYSWSATTAPPAREQTPTIQRSMASSQQHMVQQNTSYSSHAVHRAGTTLPVCTCMLLTAMLKSEPCFACIHCTQQCRLHALDTPQVMLPAKNSRAQSTLPHLGMHEYTHRPLLRGAWKLAMAALACTRISQSSLLLVSNLQAAVAVCLEHDAHSSSSSLLDRKPSSLASSGCCWPVLVHFVITAVVTTLAAECAIRAGISPHILCTSTAI